MVIFIHMEFQNLIRSLYDANAAWNIYVTLTEYSLLKLYRKKEDGVFL